LLGTNRRACIILEDESLTNFFDLDRGNAQGDNISPFSFNIAYQILIFKLNFDLQISRLNDRLEVLPGLEPLPDSVGDLNRKTFAFADDGNVLTALHAPSLVRIKNILEIYGSLSGLICNVEKMSLLLIGTELPDLDIVELGFNICNEITVLGLTIQKDTYLFDTSFEKICLKIRNIIAHWSRFNLSLPGRINIAKTFLYSQVNYLGCFLVIPQPYIVRIETMIEKFVTGKIRISKKRIYLPPADGGLGLFDISKFLSAQRCSWIKRALRVDDLWKYKIYRKSQGCVYEAKTHHFCINTEPTIYGIVSSFERFNEFFTKYKENFWKSKLFNNKALPISIRLGNPLTENELSPIVVNLHISQVKNLNIDDLYTLNRSRIKTLPIIQRDTGIPFTMADHEKIKKICTNAKLKYTKTKIDEKSSMSLLQFLELKTKGSKIYRKISTINKSTGIPHNMIKFSDSTETIINLVDSRCINKSWNFNFFSNSTRTFLFKFHNNTAGYNSAVSHFVRGHSANCTFCTLSHNPDPNRETALHLFYSCRSTEPILNQAFSHFIGEDVIITRQELFVKFTKPEKDKNEVLFILTKLFIKYIWDCKVRQTLPVLRCCINQMLTEIECIKKISRTIMEQAARSNLNINPYL
jgi:hypothetical protein